MDNNNRANGNNSSKRGFASMDEARQREIASTGGKAAHAKGTAHQFTSSEAAEAGRRGGKASHSSGNRSNQKNNPGSNMSSDHTRNRDSNTDYADN
jgi:hypothetical protein